MRHDKVKCILCSASRYLFGRPARAMTTNVILKSMNRILFSGSYYGQDAQIPTLQPTLTLPAEKAIQGDIPLGLMQTSLRSRISQMPHGRHIKEERKEIKIEKFSHDGSSHQTGDAVFTPATPHDLHHSKANNDSHNSHSTQHTRVKQTKAFALRKKTLSPA